MSADDQREQRVAESHECSTPFWRTSDDRWACPTCGQDWRWHSKMRTVPGVPAEACTVRVNTWERATTVDGQP
jgi:hypothetical protein